MTADLIMIYAIPVFFLLIGVELLVGIWTHRKFYRLNDAVANISCGITQQLFGVLLKLLGFGLYLFLYQYRIISIPNTWWSYLFLFVLIDMLYYWFHRYSHEINTFWGAHVVHHQSEEYNLSVALRQSAFQGIFSSAFYLPLALLGFAPIPFAIINTFQTLYQFWIHTEAINKMPTWFEFIFNTPSHHRVHHGRNPEYIDKNHGGTLIIFDRLFGTFEPEQAPVVYGVTKPLNTWNPIWANFDYYADLLKESARFPRFIDKLRLWVDRPGWRPKELGGLQVPPPVERETTSKYDQSIPWAISVYVFVQFVLILVGATIFLIVVNNISLAQSFALSVIIFWAAGNLGAILDRRAWGLWLEYLRLLALPFLYMAAFGMFSFSFGAVSLPLIWLLVGLSVVSLLWVLLFHRKLKEV